MARRKVTLSRLSGVQLLAALIILFVSFPFLETLRAESMIETILLTAVFISAVLAVAERRQPLIIAAILGLPTLAARWIHQISPDMMPPEVFLIGGIFLVSYVIGNLLQFVLKAKSINIELLCEGISVYLLLGLLWAFGYWLVAEINPQAFSFNVASELAPSIKGFNGLYFSLITLNTVGYGDISPVAPVARMLAAMESMTGLFYMAILIARLVALHSAPKSANS